MTTEEKVAVTTRMLKTARKPKKPAVLLHCPSCRASRRCTAVGTATVNGKRREIVQCGDGDCELVWLPSRSNIPAVPTTN